MEDVGTSCKQSSSANRAEATVTADGALCASAADEPFVLMPKGEGVWPTSRKGFEHLSDEHWQDLCNVVTSADGSSKSHGSADVALLLAGTGSESCENTSFGNSAVAAAVASDFALNVVGNGFQDCYIDQTVQRSEHEAHGKQHSRECDPAAWIDEASGSLAQLREDYEHRSHHCKLNDSALETAPMFALAADTSCKRDSLDNRAAAADHANDARCVNSGLEAFTEQAAPSELAQADGQARSGSSTPRSQEQTIFYTALPDDFEQRCQELQDSAPRTAKLPIEDVGNSCKQSSLWNRAVAAVTANGAVCPSVAEQPVSSTHQGEGVWPTLRKNGQHLCDERWQEVNDLRSECMALHEQLKDSQREHQEFVSGVEAGVEALRDDWVAEFTLERLSLQASLDVLARREEASRRVIATLLGAQLELVVRRAFQAWCCACACDDAGEASHDEVLSICNMAALETWRSMPSSSRTAMREEGSVEPGAGKWFWDDGAGGAGAGAAAVAAVESEAEEEELGCAEFHNIASPRGGGGGGGRSQAESMGGSPSTGPGGLWAEQIDGGLLEAERMVEATGTVPVSHLHAAEDTGCVVAEMGPMSDSADLAAGPDDVTSSNCSPATPPGGAWFWDLEGWGRLSAGASAAATAEFHNIATPAPSGGEARTRRHRRRRPMATADAATAEAVGEALATAAALPAAAVEQAECKVAEESEFRAEHKLAKLTAQDEARQRADEQAERRAMEEAMSRVQEEEAEMITWAETEWATLKVRSEADDKVAQEAEIQAEHSAADIRKLDEVRVEAEVHTQRAAQEEAAEVSGERATEPAPAPRPRSAEAGVDTTAATVVAAEAAAQSSQRRPPCPPALARLVGSPTCLAATANVGGRGDFSSSGGDAAAGLAFAWAEPAFVERCTRVYDDLHEVWLKHCEVEERQREALGAVVAPPSLQRSNGSLPLLDGSGIQPAPGGSCAVSGAGAPAGIVLAATRLPNHDDESATAGLGADGQVALGDYVLALRDAIVEQRSLQRQLQENMKTELVGGVLLPALAVSSDSSTPCGDCSGSDYMTPELGTEGRFLGRPRDDSPHRLQSELESTDFRRWCAPSQPLPSPSVTTPPPVGSSTATSAVDADGAGEGGGEGCAVAQRSGVSGRVLRALIREARANDSPDSEQRRPNLAEVATAPHALDGPSSHSVDEKLQCQVARPGGDGARPHVQPALLYRSDEAADSSGMSQNLRAAEVPYDASMPQRAVACTEAPRKDSTRALSDEQVQSPGGQVAPVLPFSTILDDTSGEGDVGIGYAAPRRPSPPAGDGPPCAGPPCAGSPCLWSVVDRGGPALSACIRISDASPLHRFGGPACSSSSSAAAAAAAVSTTTSGAEDARAWPPPRPSRPPSEEGAFVVAGRGSGVGVVHAAGSPSPLCEAGVARDPAWLLPPLLPPPRPLLDTVAAVAAAAGRPPPASPPMHVGAGGGVGAGAGGAGVGGQSDYPGSEFAEESPSYSSALGILLGRGLPGPAGAGGGGGGGLPPPSLVHPALDGLTLDVTMPCTNKASLSIAVSLAHGSSTTPCPELSDTPLDVTVQQPTVARSLSPTPPSSPRTSVPTFDRSRSTTEAVRPTSLASLPHPAILTPESHLIMPPSSTESVDMVTTAASAALNPKLPPAPASSIECTVAVAGAVAGAAAGYAAGAIASRTDYVPPFMPHSRTSYTCVPSHNGREVALTTLAYRSRGHPRRQARSATPPMSQQPWSLMPAGLAAAATTPAAAAAALPPAAAAGPPLASRCCGGLLAAAAQAPTSSMPTVAARRYGDLLQPCNPGAKASRKTDRPTGEVSQRGHRVVVAVESPAANGSLAGHPPVHTL